MTGAVGRLRGLEEGAEKETEGAESGRTMGPLERIFHC